ncbi:MAG: hypothetical protein ACLSCU_03510 [Eubacterium sp.]
MTPTMEELKQYVGRYDIVPIQGGNLRRCGNTDLPPAKDAASKKNYYLLESVEGGEKWGRYSFLGYDPIMRVTCQEKR